MLCEGTGPQCSLRAATAGRASLVLWACDVTCAAAARATERSATVGSHSPAGGVHSYRGTRFALRGSGTSWVVLPCVQQ